MKPLTIRGLSTLSLRCPPLSQVNVWGNNAVKNLETFWVVGVVEQYEGLLEVLQTLMDPEYRYPAVWAEAHERQENS